VALELADIFRQYGPDYRQKYAQRMLPSHRRAMRAIEQCRTPALGGQAYVCPQCHQTQYSYHSCRNRHCPKCQNDKAQAWLEQQQNFLLPVPYFMLTFTIPAALRPIARSHQATVYDLLFRASAESTQQLAQDPRFVGGQLGLIGILHTWGRNLSYHPHIHYLIPAGGLSTDHRTWLPAHPHFLLPVKTLSRIFRAKFHHALQKSGLANDIPPAVWKQDWVVHCKPVSNGHTALKYLAPYVFRVAISNRRLVKLENNQVTFRYRSSDTGQNKFCTLSVDDFIHRFLQHVLPWGFVKIRYFGFFGSSQRLLLTTLRLLLESDSRSPLADKFPAQSLSFPRNSWLCPICGKALLHLYTIPPTGRCPP
jgi:Putative transposase/Transposase zinc-binding domain